MDCLQFSMLGCNMFRLLDLRLQDIFRTKRPFGGLHVILLGDMFQLPAVQDPPIFTDPNPAEFTDRWANFKLTELTTVSVAVLTPSVTYPSGMLEG
ncbi:MAG: hypothetical protein GY820_27805 [Gammaproteobacteria bacterium]|nr:hypothetical protein [Gammaproteobacteria bacterium]